MNRNRTSIGLEAHARSVVGCAIDDETGEAHCRRLTPDNREIEAWVRSLPQPWKVTYEAGPTGFGLARHLNGVGIETVVAAPSKLQRPAGDRVETDARADVMRARHWVSKLLLRQGIFYSGAATWTQAHDR